VFSKAYYWLSTALEGKQFKLKLRLYARPKRWFLLEDECLAVKKPNRLGIITKGSEDAISLAKEVMKACEKIGGISYVLDEETASKLGVKGVKIEEMDIDIAVAIGGDGTILKLAQKLRKPNTPIFGINLGTIGFLSSVEPSEALSALEKVLLGDYQVEERAKLASFYDGIRLPDALNEVLVITSTPAKVINVEVLNGDFLLFRGRLDGVMVATATGSTAYALSTGGAFIDPTLDIMEVAFICPMDLGLKPMVLPRDSELKIRLLEGGAKAQIVVDGQFYKPMDFNKEIKVRSSEHRTRFVVFDRLRAYKKYRSKMGLFNVR